MRTNATRTGARTRSCINNPCDRRLSAEAQSTSSPSPSPDAPRAAFVTTHWSVVLSAGRSDSTHAQAALASLCRDYWYPLCAYVRRRGHGPEDAQDLTDGGSWAVSCTSPQVFRLFEVADPAVEHCILTYRARLKSEGLVGHAYLEMWCRFPGRGEAFSRGLDKAISGSNDWSTFQIPFRLQSTERPDLIRLNLVVEGTGKVFIKDIELQTGPLP